MSPVPPAPIEPRLQRNDRLILDATAAVAARGGWAALSLTAVAVEAGLSRRAVQSRCAHRTALAIALWEDRAGHTLGEALAEILRAAGLLDGRTLDRSALASALRAIGTPDMALTGAAEILLSSAYDGSLGAVVRDSLGLRVRAWCASDAPALNARRGFLLIAALGLLLDAHRPDVPVVDWQHIADLLAEVLTRDAQPQPLPPLRVAQFSTEIDFGTGDPITDALLRSVLSEVGRRGFDDTTTVQICSAAGFSEGVLFKRYDSKLDLFLDASHRQTALGLEANMRYLHNVGMEYGDGVATAIALREMMHPDVWSQRATAREQARLSWRNAELRATLEDSIHSAMEAVTEFSPDYFGPNTKTMVHFEHAVGLGPAALPILVPDASELAFDVVTVPLAQYLNRD